MKKYSHLDDDIPFSDDEQPFFKKPAADKGRKYKMVALTFVEKTKNYVAGAKPTVYPEIEDALWRFFRPDPKSQTSVAEFQKYSLEATFLHTTPDRLCVLAFDTGRINPYGSNTLDKPVNAFTGLPNLKIRSRGLSQHEKEYRDLCEIRDTALSEKKTTYKKEGVTYSLGQAFEQQLRDLRLGVSILCELTEAWLQRSAQIREFNKNGYLELLSNYTPDRQIEMIRESKRILADCIEQMYEYCYSIYYRGSEIDLVYGRALSALQTERYHTLSDLNERQSRGAQAELSFDPAARSPRMDSRNWRGDRFSEVYEPEFGGSDDYDPYRDENPPRQRHPSFIRRCVVDVAPRVGVGRAFGICTATMKKAGYYDEDGNLTEKGRKRQRHFSAQKDMREYDEKYERLLAAARKK
jgi:hypothetical protein